MCDDACLPGPAARRRMPTWLPLASVTAAISAGVLWLYVSTVAGASDLAAVATTNARLLQRIEERWHLGDVTRGLQGDAVPDAMREVAALVYVAGYWPFLAVAAVVLWLRDRSRLVRYGVALALSGLVGVVAMALIPVAPPRLVGGGDPLAASALGSVAHPQGLFNPYAAMPSFHVGWSILAAAALGSTMGRWRSLAWAQPALMSLAVVVTSNHWSIDVLAGAALAVLALKASTVLVDASAARVGS